MGFCSGTQIFDDTLKVILWETEIPEVARRNIIEGLIIALHNHDWDCEQDSRYYEHPDVKFVMEKLFPELKKGGI